MTKLDSYKFEMTCGLLTGLFGVINFLFALSADSYTGKPLNSMEDFLRAVLVFLGLPILVAAGSYIHAVKQSILGILMITVGAVFSILLICAVLISLLFSPYYSSLTFVMFLAPNLMAVTTLIVSIVEKFNRTKPYSSSISENLST